MAHIISRDGTKIAFDHFGEGAPVILIGGLLCKRHQLQELAIQLALSCNVINFDRRGRGESSDTPPYAVEREIEDIEAVIGACGGSAAVYGHSSGAGLALNAAASGLSITKLVLHEPPYGPDDEASRRNALELAESVQTAIKDGRRADAIHTFLSAAGVSPAIVESLRTDPEMLQMAPTMVYDHEVMGDFDRGGTIPVDLVCAIDIPTLVIAGVANPDFFRDTAAQLAELLKNGKLLLLEGQDHNAAADVVSPVIASFLNDT